VRLFCNLPMSSMCAEKRLETNAEKAYSTLPDPLAGLWEWTENEKGKRQGR